jgi:hypothetical protein
MFKVLDGVVPDQIDRNPLTISTRPKITSKASLIVGKPEFVTINAHAHPLKLHLYESINMCDICSLNNFQAGYRCIQGCDYDCCFFCSDKTLLNSH